MTRPSVLRDEEVKRSLLDEKMGLLDLLNKYKRPKKETILIDGFELDDETGEILTAPSDLTVYNLPAETTKISWDASVTMSRTAVQINFHPNSKITVLPPGIFKGFYQLEKIQLPDSLETIDNIVDHKQFQIDVPIPGTDMKYRGLVYNIPASLREIYFQDIPSRLERIVFGNNLKKVRGSIIAHHSCLKYVELPGSLERLEPFAIRSALALETLVINEGIVEMDFGAISGCNSLTDIHIPNSLHEFYLGSDDYRGIPTPDGGTFHVPESKANNRQIKLHKTINGQKIIFEVNRQVFLGLAVTANEVDISGYRIPLENLEMGNHYVIDIKEKRIVSCSPISDGKTTTNKTGGVPPIGSGSYLQDSTESLPGRPRR